ncbi:MAG: hypothetical protein COV47_01615 [Candidatus Diapherotrites archaeon CG11_big_fil_rev_8_21_14_0_20_37_9]|nr:MAG: hypothetical protein COV47_01615 [Candidatus Diapherotrites archaeon CG11_big_fil_rev_8_21_14_0_20_37_9]
MNDKRPVRIILKEQAKAEFEKLNKIVGKQQTKGITNSEEMKLLKAIKQKSDLIKQNPLYGNNIPKKQIPKTLTTSNLFRVELTGYWRMLYSLEGNQIEIIAFVLYLVDHPAYDKLFGYKRK